MMSSALSGSSLPVLVHLGAALTSVVLGAVQWFASRGGSRHRGLGYAWVAAMLLTALSSFFIHGRFSRDWLGGFSLIHGLSIFTLVSLAMAVNHARHHRIDAHRRWMRGSFASLLVAGLFAALSPGRQLNELLFTSLPHTLLAMLAP